MDMDADRIRRHTATALLQAIDDVTTESLTACAEAPADTSRRLIGLEREWDTDRALETEAATMGLVGLALGAFVRRELLALPVIVAGAVLLQALTGRYPLMPLFRRLKVRTAKEIARERYALKALRGDFAGVRQRQTAAAPAGEPAAGAPGRAEASPRLSAVETRHDNR